MEEGREFWGRYPLEFQAGISMRACISPLHARMLKSHYFPVVGSVPKHFVGKNRRHLDFNVSRFEDDQQKEVDRDGWGLPTPNLEASYLSLAKYAKDVMPLTPKIVAGLNCAFSWMERQFAPAMMNSRVKPLDEVVAGLDMSTSPGWPWVAKYKTKRAMVDEWKEFHQYMEDDWQRLKDPNWTAVFGNSLKEEIRPAEKIVSNSIRTFTAGPIEATIHGNRLFEDMNQKFYDSHLRTASVVGFSPLKGGWNDLFSKLKKYRRGFALDESQYDSSLRSYLMWNCAEFRWKMLRNEDRTEDNFNRLRTYYRNLINTLILTSEGVFVMKLGGNPSGSVNTISDNTLILYVLLAYAWIQTVPEEMRTYEAFEAHTAKALVGDDNTFTVSEEAIGYFNAKSIIPTWAAIGITTTTDSMEPRPVEELDFLSAHTTFVDGCAVPLYARDKLLTSLLYSRFPNDPAYTLTRATALQRVAWADVPMRNYLQDFVSWLLEEYDHVLYEEPNWKLAKNQIPLDHELKALFLGKERFPLFNQGRLCEKCHKEQLKNRYHCRWCRNCEQEIRARIKRKAETPAWQRFYQTVYPELFPLQNQCCGIEERSNSRIKTSEQSSEATLDKVTLDYMARRGNKKKGARAPGQKLGPRMQSGAFRSKRVQPQRQRKRRAPRVVGGSNNRDFSGVRARGPDGSRTASKRNTFDEDEFVVDLLGNTTFGSGTTTGQAIQFPINPGQALLFPRLSKIAQLYEKYRFTKLQFYYKHEVTQFATAGTIGKAIYHFDTDAGDSPPTSKAQMMASDLRDHVDKMPCEDFVLNIDVRRAFENGPKYVRPGILPGGSDIKTYDIGNLNIAFSGTSDASTKLGELHVRYAGYFEKPVLESSTSAPINNQVAWFQSPSGESLTSTVAKTLAVSTASANGLTAVNTAGSIVLPPGNYMVDAIVNAVFSADNQLFGIVIEKNGASINPVTPFVTLSGAADTSCQLVAGGFVTSNGTDVFILQATATFAAGTGSASGSFRFVAV